MTEQLLQNNFLESLKKAEEFGSKGENCLNETNCKKLKELYEKFELEVEIKEEDKRTKLANNILKSYLDNLLSGPESQENKKLFNDLLIKVSRNYNKNLIEPGKLIIIKNKINEINELSGKTKLENENPNIKQLIKFIFENINYNYLTLIEYIEILFSKTIDEIRDPNNDFYNGLFIVKTNGEDNNCNIEFFKKKLAEYYGKLNSDESVKTSLLNLFSDET